MTGTRRSRLLALVALAMLAATPAIAATPTTVRVHGTETWTPTMEVALDEVAMLWTGEPRGANTPPTLVDGTSVLRAGREAAAIRLTGVTTVADLVTRAGALRDWDSSDKGASQRFGDRWYDEGRSLVLLVPSLAARGLERNVLINQRHPAFGRLTASHPDSIRCHPTLLV